VLVSAEPAFYEEPQLRGAVAEIEAKPGFRLWRDDYSSVYAVLK
jgi:hypothetical protein